MKLLDVFFGLDERYTVVIVFYHDLAVGYPGIVNQFILPQLSCLEGQIGSAFCQIISNVDCCGSFIGSFVWIVFEFFSFFHNGVLGAAAGQFHYNRAGFGGLSGAILTRLLAISVRLRGFTKAMGDLDVFDGNRRIKFQVVIT